jgi:hypothetical protein
MMLATPQFKPQLPWSPDARKTNDAGTTCATCNGIGAVPADGLTRNCPECAGSGKAENAIGTTRRHELTAAVINAHPLTIGAPMTDEQIRAWAFRDECLIDLCEKLEERCEELAAENRSLSQGIVQTDNVRDVLKLAVRYIEMEMAPGEAKREWLDRADRILAQVSNPKEKSNG